MTSTGKFPAEAHLWRARGALHSNRKLFLGRL